jgi:cytochrome c peroxidase
MKIKRLMVLAGITMAIVPAMIITYHLMSTPPPNGIGKDRQAAAILTAASCSLCHARASVAERTTNDEAGRSLLLFDIGEGIERINREEAVDEVTLAKIEMATVVRRNMPPVGYRTTRWGSSVTPAKRKILMEWIAAHREKFYPNPLAADRFKNEPVRPLPAPMPVNEKKAALGETLFYDVRLSQNGTISCASCHDPGSGGADGRQYPEGIRHILGGVNTPTVFNACFNASQFRDGRAPDLPAHAAEHLADPLAMAAVPFDTIIDRLLNDGNMKQSFDHLYGCGITLPSVIDAIEAFEKTLITPDCRFDRYLRGEAGALNESEMQGYEAFKSNTCATCHTGAILGGLSHERMGIYKDYFKDRGWEITREDRGRFNLTSDEYDRYRFKVPGLRNVALTKPYFHDGSRQTLYDAIKVMAAYQTGRSISDRDIEAIVSFLESLTGEYVARRSLRTASQ